MKRFVTLLAALVGATLIGSPCRATPPPSPAITVPVPAHLRSPFAVPASAPWVQTPIFPEKGRWYRITAQIRGTEYKDWLFPCSPDGPKVPFLDLLFRAPSAFNPARLVGPGATKRLRILRDATADRRRASFLTLIATIGKSDTEANAIVIGSQRDFQAPSSGPLFLFANDWPGGNGEAGDARFINMHRSGRANLPPTAITAANSPSP